MAIELAKKYLPLLDAKYQKESVTSVLDAPANMVRETGEANSILVPKMTVSGLGDYSKTTGYPAGAASLVWETHTFTQDRGTQFSIDRMDNIETIGMAFGQLAGEFIRTAVAPELDAYRFAQYNSLAGNTTSATPTASNIVDIVDTAIYTMNDAEVPDLDRVLFISNECYNYLKQSAATRFANVQVNNGVISRDILTYDGMQVVKVPAPRFYSAYTFNDGSSTFGFTAAAGAVGINFMVVHKSAPMQVVKTALPKIFSPEVNQTADAWLFQYRLYHDAFVTDNKVNGIYVHTK